MRFGFRNFISRLGLAAVAAFVFQTGVAGISLATAQTETDVAGGQARKTTEPIFRVPNVNRDTDALTNDQDKKGAVVQEPAGVRVAENNTDLNVKGPRAILPKMVAPHPLDRAVEYAHTALEQIQTEVYDYTALLAKREQVNGVVGKTSFMNIKVRCPRNLEDGTQSRFSIYMKFLKPKDAAGREVIWVDGRNEGKLAVHQMIGPFKRRFDLDPMGLLAMRGQRYPIYEAGMENLIIKLIEKAERDRAAGPCIVNYRENGEVNKRPCSIIELIHTERKAPYEFYKAQVFIDKELNLPVRFAAYDWPTSPGAKPKLIEEYTYYKVKINVGLTENDFDPKNKAYDFPGK